MKESYSHRQLLSYMLGWQKGAGSCAFTDDQMKDPDFKDGYENGRAVKTLAYECACQKYKTTLNQIRPQ